MGPRPIGQLVEGRRPVGPLVEEHTREQQHIEGLHIEGMRERELRIDRGMAIHRRYCDT